jgi:hypothetical protein
MSSGMVETSLIIALPISNPFLHQQSYANTGRFITIMFRRVLRLEDFRIEAAAVGLQGFFVIYVLLKKMCLFNHIN